MYDIVMLWLICRGHSLTDAEMQQLHHDYFLSASAQRLYRKGPDFEEPLCDDVFTEEEHV